MRKIQVGDFVAVDGCVFDRKEDVQGTVTNLCTYHIVIRDTYDIQRSVQNSDIPHIHLIRAARSRDREQLQKDIGDATQGGSGKEKMK